MYTSEYTAETLCEETDMDDLFTYADLTYNEATKSYSCTVTEDGVTGVITLWFEDGKLVKLTTEASMEETEDGVTMRMHLLQTYVFSNFGTTTVKIPEDVVIPEPEATPAD